MDNKLKCKICEFETNSYISFGLHITRKHKMKVKKYYDMFLKKENEDICNLEECNNKTTFHSLRYGYHECCSLKCSNNLPARLEFSKLTAIEQHKREDIKKMNSIRMKRLWKNEDFRKKMTTPRVTFRKEQANKLSKKFEKDLEFQERYCKKMKEINSDETRRNKISISLKKYYKENPEYREAQRQRMLGGQSAKCNSFICNPSKPQVKLYNLVKQLYIQTILNYSFLNYSIDIVIPDLMISIEYDGSYWHKNKEYDSKRQKELEKCGWKFIRYTDKNSIYRRIG